MAHRFTLTALVLCASIGCSYLLAAAPDRAAAILDQAREAIGGQARLRAVHALSLKITSQSDMDGGAPVSTTLAMHFLMPDKFLVARDWPFSFTRRIGGFSGNQLVEQRLLSGVWADVGFGDGGTDALARQLAARRRECLRYLLAWLLTAPEQYGLQFSDGGEAGSPGAGADLVDVKGASDFAVRLSFDRQTHHLITLTYREPPANGVPASDPSTASRDNQVFKSIEGPAAPETRMRLEQYRADDGIVFPHRVTIELEGLRDVWRISRFTVNPRLTSRQFEKR